MDSNTFVNIKTMQDYYDIISLQEKSWNMICVYLIENFKNILLKKNITKEGITDMINSINGNISSLKQSSLNLQEIIQEDKLMNYFCLKLYVTYVQIKFFYFYFDMQGLILESNNFSLNSMFYSLINYFKN